MTKHLYLCSFNNRPAYVLIGWDNNRMGFYMVFDYQSGMEESAIFSSLFSKNPYPKTLDEYLAYLTKQGITLPEPMINSILRDSFRRSESNEVTHVINDNGYETINSIDYAIL